MLDFLKNLVLSWFQHLGYLGVVLAMAIESCLIPLPSEIIMPLAGALCGAAFAHSLGFEGAPFNLIGVTIAGGIGSVIGSAVAYWIGAKGGRPFIYRYGKYLLISRHDFEQADKAFAKYGSAIAFFSRNLPVLRTYISLPAGITRMNQSRFLLYTFLGSLPWSFILAFAGYKLGDHYENIGNFLHKFDYVVIGVLVVLIGLYVYRHIRNERAYAANGTGDGDATLKLPRQQPRSASDTAPTQRMPRR
jgi:membrane protein DedA with SNARE-associated domain